MFEQSKCLRIYCNLSSFVLSVIKKLTEFVIKYDHPFYENQRIYNILHSKVHILFNPFHFLVIRNCFVLL